MQVSSTEQLMKTHSVDDEHYLSDEPVGCASSDFGYLRHYRTEARETKRAKKRRKKETMRKKRQQGHSL